jgi:hypothetical protein
VWLTGKGATILGEGDRIVARLEGSQADVGIVSTQNCEARLNAIPFHEAFNCSDIV